MVTRSQLSEYVEKAPAGKAMVYGMAASLVTAIISGDAEEAEAQRKALADSGFTSLEIDRHGWEARMRYLDIVSNHGPLEDAADVQTEV